ncbi:hypothetical protein PINS_up007416 [Pythium insidiosum]|nr:hypothetical protein PINS_up007416 [Pythium insidiosum]
MALRYEDGMATLRSIFPSWDPQVLSELLDANDGHLENTIEMALSMEPPAPSSRPATPSRSPPPPSPAPAPAPAPSSPVSRSRQLPYNPPRVSPRARGRDASGRRSRVTLPDDFLRLPGDDSDAASAARPLSDQEQRDEMLARMLQDEIFRQELMADEELSAHFQDRRRPSQIASASREKSASEIATETFNTMSEKFASMSEVAKKKMHEMYLKFQTRSDAPAKRDPYRYERRSKRTLFRE